MGGNAAGGSGRDTSTWVSGHAARWVSGAGDRATWRVRGDAAGWGDRWSCSCPGRLGEDDDRVSARVQPMAIDSVTGDGRGRHDGQETDL